MTRVLVFDLGGVLYDLRGDRLLRKLSRRRFRSAEEHDTWLPLLRRYETGNCDDRQFAEQALEACDLTGTAAEFLTEFRAAAIGFYPGALALLRALSERHRLLSLSNMNPLQWSKVLADLGATDPFEAHHPSHLSGFHKPDPRAFRAVTDEHGVPRYFFDDREVNVRAAQELGFQAHRVRGVAALRRACEQLKLLA